MRPMSRLMSGRLAYLGIRVIHFVLTSLPQAQQKALFRRLGTLAYYLFRRRRRIGLRNIALVRARMDFRLLPAVFENLALTAQEFLLGSWSNENSPILQVTDGSQETWRTILNSPGGVIFATAHLGNWEILGANSGALVGPVYAIFRPLDNLWLDRWVSGFRTRSWQKLISKHDSPMLTAARLLSNGQNIGILVDQRPRHRSVIVDFFGRPTPTTIASALLSLRTGAPIVPICAIRDHTQSHLKVSMGAPIYPKPEQSDRLREIQRITQEFTRTLESWIQLYPEQWLWLHRRWPKSEYAAARRRQGSVSS